MISALLGGALGIFGADAVGFNTSIWIAAAVYGFSAFLLWRISHPLDHRHPRAGSLGEAFKRVGGELSEGLSAIWERRRARLALIAVFILRTIGMFVVVAAILVIKQVFPGRLEDLGRVSTSALALGAAGAGAFIGATLAPLFARRLDKGGLVILGYVISAVTIVVFGGVVNIAAVSILTFFGGVGGFITKVAVDAQIQEALPDELRGRAFALYDILYNLASVAAAGLMVVGSSLALRPRLISAGLAAGVAAALLAVAMSRSDMPMTIRNAAASAPPA
jgi:MFS family permease